MAPESETNALGCGTSGAATCGQIPACLPALSFHQVYAHPTKGLVYSLTKHQTWINCCATYDLLPPMYSSVCMPLLSGSRCSLDLSPCVPLGALSRISFATAGWWHQPPFTSRFAVVLCSLCQLVLFYGASMNYNAIKPANLFSLLPSPTTVFDSTSPPYATPTNVFTSCSCNPGH